MRYVVNRADSAGGIRPDDLARALGRAPDHSIVSDGKLVVEANNEGVPFVLASPEAQISLDVATMAAALVGDLGARPRAALTDVRPASDRRLRLRRWRADRPARDRASHAARDA